ncbi:hypothetical protein [Bifidobacterium crudilactis]|uniref:hypothetical protein n=1 Tax=Bifidobacterium crudilactis TaxID=327277 RepID=UPI002F357A9F|nr:hypothetical protein [Bifidobacterium crudilactis]
MFIAQSVVFGIIGGMLCRGIFAILRLRQHTLDSPVGYAQVEAAMNYMTAPDFVNQSAGRRWTQYLLFKTIPVIVSSVLVAGLNQSAQPNNWDSLILALSTFLVMFYIPDLLLRLKNRTAHEYTSIRLFKFCLFLLNTSLCLAVFASTFFVDYTRIIPSFADIKGNLWSTLFVAIIIAWFIQFTDMNPKSSQAEASTNEWKIFIEQQCEIISSKYELILLKTSEKYAVNRMIMKSILVYENLNRPLFIRYVENLFVNILPFPLTVGIAQVSSKKRLSDDESIDEMGRILGRTVEALDDSLGPDCWLLNLLKVYNDEQYATNVIDILAVLAPDWRGKIKLWNS